MFRFVWRLMFSFGRFWVSSSRFTTWPFTFIRNTYQKTFYLWNQIFLSSLGCHLQLDCSSSVSSMTRDSHTKKKRFQKTPQWSNSGQVSSDKIFPWLQFRKRPDRAIVGFLWELIWYLFRSKPMDKSNFAETLSDFSHHLTVNVRYLHPMTLIRRYYSDFRSNPSGLPSSCRSDSLLNTFYLPV